MGKQIRRFAAADCETDPFEFGKSVSPFVWGFYDEDGYKQFQSTVDFVAHIQEYDGIVYFHNGGKFDVRFLLPWIRGKVLSIHGRLAKCQLGKAELRDSYCLFPMPLSAYRKDDFDYTKLHRDQRAKFGMDITRYLYGDCKYLYELLCEFVANYGQHITLAGAAMDYWTKKFSPSIRYFKGDTGARWFDTFKHYYVGGRVECFKSGEISRDFSVWDINSAYPHVMSGELPWGFKTYTSSKLYADRANLGFFDVAGTSYGAFPAREKGRKLHYPHVRGTFSVPGTELIPAMRCGRFRLEKVHRAIYFKESVTFADYIDHFYRLKDKAKREGNHAEYLFAKLMLNSLYGKYGANPARYREHSIIDGDAVGEFAGKGYGVTGLPGCDAFMIDKAIAMHARKYFNVATAAAITGGVRGMMIEAIAGASGLIYCDTDSIAAESADLRLSNRLGDWDCEAECDAAYVAGKKLYAFHLTGKGWNDETNGRGQFVNFKTASKGTRLKPSQIRGIAAGGAVRWQKEAPTFRGSAQTFLKRRVYMTV